MSPRSMGDVSSRHFQNGPKCSLRGVLSSVGWQHHPDARCSACRPWRTRPPMPPRHGAPHMPPSKPRHANAKRARQRHAVGALHAAAVTQCPVPLHPGPRPMPPLPDTPSPMQQSALRALGPVPPVGSTLGEHVPRKSVPMADVAAHPGLTHASRPALPIKARGRPSPCSECPPVHSARLGSPKALELRACCLGKAAMAGVAAHPGAHPCLAQALPVEGTRMPLPMQREPSRVLGPSSRRGASSPRRACCLRTC